MNSNKCLEYFLDSKIYSNEEVQNNIDKTKREFPNKNIKVNVFLNEFGVYEVTFVFENKNTFFNRIKIFFRKKHNSKLLLAGNKEPQKYKYVKQFYNQNTISVKVQERFEMYSGDNKYGKYKNTGNYRPY